jgi:MoaA/NifB/PqqE/SkfB family radical SAM enzyme
LSNNHFSIAYFTGGETSLHPHLGDALKYAKEKGLITSITTNGTIKKEALVGLKDSLDVLSVSVDSYDSDKWDQAKNFPGISRLAIETIKQAKRLGISTYAVTFLNPLWSILEVDRVVEYVNNEIGIPFALSYPFISANSGSYKVGGEFANSKVDFSNIRRLVAHILDLKIEGANIATSTGYMKEVLRAFDNLPLKYPCKAARTILTIDCNLDVYPCYKKKKIFNLQECGDLNFREVDSSLCDNERCMINCFKEASQASRATGLHAIADEILSSRRFYRSLLL